MTHRGHAVSRTTWRRWLGVGTFVVGCLSGFTAASAEVTAPFDGEALASGESYTVSWDPLGACSVVTIDLYEGTRFRCTIATDVPDDGTYNWSVGLCGGPPGCNLRLRISCAGESVWSAPFAVDALLLERVDPGSRNVQLVWSRVAADTLGAKTRPDTTTRRVFGGYNIWRRVYDNQLDPTVTERFTKIRSYDIEFARSDTVPRAWTFDQTAERFGPVEVEIDEITTEVQRWAVAQTFTTPEGGASRVCNFRVYHASVFHRWTVTARITPVDAMGFPVIGTVLAADTLSYGSNDNQSGFRWINFPLTVPATLSPGTTYALVLTGVSPQGVQFNPRITWVRSTFDALPGGTAMRSTDNGASWTALEGSDFAFVLGGGPVSSPPGCRDFIAQRLGGDFQRHFNDPDSILALTRNEEGELVELDPTGPFDGFQLEYAVTMFEKVLLPSGNTETPSSCEDTLFTSSGFPLGVQPSEAAVWPELIFPQSAQPRTAPLLRDVYPVPNPYVRDVASPSFPRWERPGERRIEFFNLPAGARIQIFTLAGDRVRTFEHDGPRGSASWDLRNESGEIVVSGVYIWMVTADTGETKRGQLVIVR